MGKDDGHHVAIQQLMMAGCHLGHSVDVWHKQMLPFIYGRRAGIHIINLEHTLIYLRRAVTVTREIAARGGTILFVGQRPFMQEILVEAARHAGQFYVHGKWLDGCLINHTRTLRTANPLGSGGTYLQPDLVVVLDMNECASCLDEVSRVHVPSIGLVDTDCNPDQVTYPIPANDDSVASVELIASVLANAARDGKLDRQRMKKHMSSFTRDRPSHAQHQQQSHSQQQHPSHHQQSQGKSYAQGKKRHGSKLQ